MKLYGITIRAYTGEGDYVSHSPHGEITTGWRLRIGGALLRLGAKIMFKKQWVTERIGVY